MRVSLALEYDGTLLWINRKKEEISTLANAISSGTKLTAPSDAPSSWSRAMGLKQGLREYDAILGNLEFASGWNQASDSALTRVSDLVSRSQQLAISATGGRDMGQEGIVAELDGILKEIISAANAQYGDQYIFAGSKTAEKPFSIDDSTGEVTYNGDLGEVKVRTERGANGSYKMNLTGTDVFSYTSGDQELNIIHEIWELKEAVEAGDSTKISAKLGTLEDAFKAVSKQSTVTGSRLSSFDTRKSALELIKANTTTRLSEVEDTDLPEAILKLQQNATAFEAALQVTTIMDNLSLTKFL